MQITRDEAIDMAVRRHMRVGSFADRGWMGIWLKQGAVPRITAQAIGSHFRAVCRQYEVRDRPRVWDVTHSDGRVYTYYDGHSLRI